MSAPVVREETVERREPGAAGAKAALAALPERADRAGKQGCSQEPRGVADLFAQREQMARLVAMEVMDPTESPAPTAGWAAPAARAPMALAAPYAMGR